MVNWEPRAVAKALEIAVGLGSLDQLRRARFLGREHGGQVLLLHGGVRGRRRRQEHHPVNLLECGVGLV